MSKRTAKDYRQLPYRRSAIPVQDESEGFYWLAAVDEIPWIRIDGATRVEALLRLDEIFDDCIESMIDAGDEVPEPELWPGELPKARSGLFPGLLARRAKISFDLPDDLPPNTRLEAEKDRELQVA